jgi:hypothetical protein
METKDMLLRLQELSSKETNVINNLKENYHEQIDELKEDLNIAHLYIDYTQKCIRLQVVPRDYGYWYAHIRESYSALFANLDI